MDACNNPDILRVIYFIKILIEIIMIIVPIGLIIMGLLDFSKSVVTNDENARKKNAVEDCVEGSVVDIGDIGRCCRPVFCFVPLCPALD